MRDDDHLGDRDLLLVIDHELAPARRPAAVAHLTNCQACRERRDRLEQATATVRELWRASAVESASVDLSRARLREQLAGIRNAGRGSLRERFVPAAARMSRWSGFGAAAAVIALVARVLIPFDAADVRMHRLAVGPDVLPVATLTPGATWKVNLDDLCAGGREQAEIPAAVRQRVLRSYGMERVPAHEYELDYLITPELGGAPDERNLWPQRYGARTWNAQVKDQLEELLPRMVCDGAVRLETAQQDIATDWVAAYRKYFNTDVPVRARAAASTIGWPQAIIRSSRSVPLHSNGRMTSDPDRAARSRARS